MKRITFILFAFFLCFACSVEEHDEDISSPKRGVSETKGSEPLYLQPETGIVIRRIANYDDKTLIDPNDVSATHYLIKFYPKDQDEIFVINQLEGCQTSYIPFGFEPLSSFELKRTAGSSIPSFPESNPNNLVIDNSKRETFNVEDSFEDIVSRLDTIHLPIIYAICAKDVVIPSDIDYVVYNALSIPEEKGGIDFPIHLIVLPLQLKTYDSFLGSYLPVEKLKIHMQYGNYVGNFFSSASGETYLNPYFYGISEDEIGELNVSLIFETPKWIINWDENSTAPAIIPLGKVKDLWPLYRFVTTTYADTLSSVTTEMPTHRALHHYHYCNNPLKDSTRTFESPVYVHCLHNNHTSWAASTVACSKHINVYNNGHSDEYIIGFLGHELGHVRHYAKINNYSLYYSSSVETIVKESFASYVGWVISEDYYTSKGYIKPSPGFSINDQFRQSWTNGCALHNYSPLFIDLVDSYNQGLADSSKPYDELDSLSYLTVDALPLLNYTVNDVFNYLTSLAGVPFTLNQLLTYKNAYL